MQHVDSRLRLFESTNALGRYLGISQIDGPERGKLRVSVTTFGPSTPVELEYWQVERA